jgi:hypothetical protein
MVGLVMMVVGMSCMLLGLSNLLAGRRRIGATATFGGGLLVGFGGMAAIDG